MLAWLVHYAPAAETFINPFTPVPIRTNAINLVLTKKGAEFLDCLLRAKWWPHLAHRIEDGGHALFVGNSERETVTRTTRWVNKCRIKETPVIRPLTNAGVDAGLYALICDEAFNVGAKLGAILGRGPRRVLLILAVDELLRKTWI